MMESPQLNGHGYGIDSYHGTPKGENCCTCKFGIVETTCDMCFFGPARTLYFGHDYDQLFCKRKPDKRRTYASNWCGEWKER